MARNFDDSIQYIVPNISKGSSYSDANAPVGSDVTNTGVCGHV